MVILLRNKVKTHDRHRYSISSKSNRAQVPRIKRHHKDHRTIMISGEETGDIYGPRRQETEEKQTQEAVW